MKIAIIGAGNIGTALAALLSQTEARLTLVARGRRLSTLRQQGVQLDDRGHCIAATVNAVERLNTVNDAVFVCVKSQDVPKALHSNAAGIGPQTLIIPMINGLPFWFFYSADRQKAAPLTDPQGLTEGLFQPQQVLGAVLLMTVRMQENGKAISTNTPTLSLAPVADGVDGAALQRLCALLAKGGVRVDVPDDIRRSVLTKLLANVATNPLSALTGVTLAGIARDRALLDLAFALADEFRSCIAPFGYQLPTNTWLGDILLDAGEFQTSMLQDALAGRALELDAICRAPLELGRNAHVTMPLLEELTTLLATAAVLPLPEEQRLNALLELQSRHLFERTGS
ncbi:2-dehydropantoate 2-reductase [Agrobacterium vitis]|nr:2-dehydropantoate 2-reductase [Agrobacterium vitis]MBE1436538.1 2-dehydropantoate 2-reductase [Agrobacterium vitis]